MKELTLKRRLNTYLYRGYPGISSNFENGTKQLEAQLESGVAYKKKSVYFSCAGFLILYRVMDPKVTPLSQEDWLLLWYK